MESSNLQRFLSASSSYATQAEDFKNRYQNLGDAFNNERFQNIFNKTMIGDEEFKEQREALASLATSAGFVPQGLADFKKGVDKVNEFLDARRAARLGRAGSQAAQEATSSASSGSSEATGAASRVTSEVEQAGARGARILEQVRGAGSRIGTAADEAISDTSRGLQAGARALGRGASAVAEGLQNTGSSIAQAGRGAIDTLGERFASTNPGRLIQTGSERFDESEFGRPFNDGPLTRAPPSTQTARSVPRAEGTSESTAEGTEMETFSGNNPLEAEAAQASTAETVGADAGAATTEAATGVEAATEGAAVAGEAGAEAATGLAATLGGIGGAALEFLGPIGILAGLGVAAYEVAEAINKKPPPPPQAIAVQPTLAQAGRTTMNVAPSSNLAAVAGASGQF